jgi:hypothetical protein
MVLCCCSLIGGVHAWFYTLNACQLFARHLIEDSDHGSAFKDHPRATQTISSLVHDEAINPSYTIRVLHHIISYRSTSIISSQTRTRQTTKLSVQP